jgi:Xaa-Pro aminopeptidase
MVADPRFIPRQGRVDDPHCALSLAERDRRWDALRDGMDRLGLDCLFVWGRARGQSGNVRWIDNGDAGERCLVFPRRADPVTLWTLGSWARWYEQSCWEGVGYAGTEGCESVAVAALIGEFGHSSGTIGVVGLAGAGIAAEGSIPWFTWENLRRLLPHARFRDAAPLLRELRMVKSAEELALVGKAAEIANLQFDAALRMVRPGVRERDVLVCMESAGLAAGAEQAGDFWTNLCSGKDFPTNRRASDRRLQSGDLLQMGLYTRFGGYWAHPHYAISLGPLDAEYRPLRDAVFEGTHDLLAALHPGTPWREVERAADAAVLRAGYYHEITQIHALGLDGSEPPAAPMTAGTLPARARRRRFEGSVRDLPAWRDFTATGPGAAAEPTVQAGMVLALEVKATHEDRIFVEFGPQVIVTPDGPRVLNPDAMDLVEL